MLTHEQKEKILEAMSDYMTLDQYGRTTIRNIYFDTENYRLIRRSIEKPVYREKLRIRSYSQASPDSTVFVELKKKYEKIVYKRRLPLCHQDAAAWVLRWQARSAWYASVLRRDRQRKLSPSFWPWVRA
jgi:SPX domain protein involved in polyphosphate accumulation